MGDGAAQFDLRGLDVLPSDEVIPIIRAAREGAVDIHVTPDTAVAEKLGRLFGGYTSRTFYGRGYQWRPVPDHPEGACSLVYTYRLDLRPEALRL